MKNVLIWALVVGNAYQILLFRVPLYYISLVVEQGLQTQQKGTMIPFFFSLGLFAFTPSDLT